jgi:hypothetical protein
MMVFPGEAILSFLPENHGQGTVVYPVEYLKDKDGKDSANNGVSDVGAGILTSRADYVIELNKINRRVFPNLWKSGPYRADITSGVGVPNGSTTRPISIAKFSELYLIAAEAAVKGGATGTRSARDLVNVLRERAGKWSFSNAENVAKTDDNSATLTAATPTTIDIYYILAERSREYFGEYYRWYDLVRTQKWNELAGTYQVCEDSKNAKAYNWSDRTEVTITRTIEKYHYLRPIPINQMNGLEMSDAEKAAYQNPGY